MARDRPPYSLGLGGDGDEVAAIEEVERSFAITLDYSDAGQWRTAGDVFAAVQRQLPPEQAESGETWGLFTEAISRETGVDPALVRPETLLLGTTRIGRRGYVLALLVVVLIFAIRRS